MEIYIKNNLTPYHFPSPEGGQDYLWDGNNFVNGLDSTRILDYSTNSDGWSDALTDLHEHTTDGSNPIDQESRRRCLKVIENYSQFNSNISLLEVGCSSGYLLRDLIQNFKDIFVIGSDVIKQALDRCAGKYTHVPLLRFDLKTCPLPTASVDVVVMLNVLEHINDDIEALRTVQRILKPSGILYIEVPNGEWLYDNFDRELMHFRRYSDKRLNMILRESGFRVDSIDHIGFLLYPLFFVVKIYGKIFTNKRVVSKQVSATDRSKVFRYIFKIEQIISEFTTFPTGIRTVVRASHIKGDAS